VSSPPPAPAPVQGRATGTGWTGRPDIARTAAGWARAVTGKRRSSDTARDSATPSNYLWQSLACLFLFLPSAVVAVVYSAQVNRRVQIGDMTGALRASRLARTWCLITVGVFTLLVLWMIAGGTAP
jgi:hypothetical protein